MTENPSPPASAGKVPRVVSCLVKGPLGCLAFFLGAGVVLVLFLPPAIGRLTDRSLEKWFNASHRGTLDMNEAWLGSLYGPQKIESLILRDPEGDEVLHAALSAPSLGQVLFEHAPQYGPVSIRVSSLRLVQGKSGNTNLARALERRPPVEAVELGEPARRGRSSNGLQLDRPLVIAIEVSIERLRCADSRGSEALFENLSFHGVLSWSDSAWSLTLEGGADPALPAALQVGLTADDAGEDPGRPWGGELRLEHTPGLLLDLLLGSSGLLARAFGPDVDQLQLRWRDVASLQGTAIEERMIEELVLEDEGTSLQMRGRLRGEAFASESDRATLHFPGDSWCARKLLPEIVPVFLRVSELEPVAGAEGGFILRAERFVWPLDADPARTEAHLELVLPSSRGELDPAVAGALSASTPTLELEPGALVAEVGQGKLVFADQRLFCNGGALTLSGTYELASRSYRALAVGLELGPANSGSTVLEGPRLSIEPPPFPEPPGLPGDR